MAQLFGIVLILTFTIPLAFGQLHDKINVTILCLFPDHSLAYSNDYYGPVTDMAIQELNQKYSRFYFYKYNFVPTNIRTCGDLEQIAVDGIIKYMLQEDARRRAMNRSLGVTFLSGTACSVTLRWLGDIAREMNLPLIASGGSAVYMTNPTRYTTMLRFQWYQQVGVGAMVVKFLRHYNWHTIAMICDDNPGLGDFILLSCAGFYSSIKHSGDMTVDDLHFDSSRTPVVDYERYLRLAAAKSRIILVTAHANRTRDIMLTAYRLGMTNGYFVYVTSLPFEHPLYGYYQWQFNDGNDDDARDAFKSLYYVSLRPLRGANFVAFETEVRYRSFRDYGLLYEPLERVNAFTAFQHTIIRFAGQLVNDTNYDWSQLTVDNGAGLEIMQLANQRQTVSSISTGDFEIDNGDRVLYTYVMVAMDHFLYNFKEVFTYDTVTKNLLPVDNNTITWVHRVGNQPPPNMPDCGYEIIDNQCSISQASLIGIICGVSIIGLVLAGGIGYFARKATKIDLSDDPYWFILPTDVHLEQIAGQNPSKTCECQCAAAGDTKAVQVIDENLPATLNSQSIATFRGQRTWYRKIPLSGKFIPTPHEEKLIRKMKSLASPNTLQFYGFIPMDLEIGVLYEIPSKGSLVNVMQDGVIRFDQLLRNSVLLDLTNGLNYLHSSSTEHHGSLSKFNCMLDHRYVLKLADYRWDILPRPLPDFNDTSPENSIFLTFAPEQLRHSTNPYLGSKEADVYAYGYLLTEIITEMEPFKLEMDTAEYTVADLIHLVQKQVTRQPFRPKVQFPYGLALLDALVRQCWDEKPTSRPTVPYIRQYLKRVPGFEREYSLVDELLRRLGAHADILESRIQAVTYGLSAEKKREEELLLQMLPLHVVTALKNGEKIDPEGFNSATIGFTALDNFGTIAATYAPFDVVTLLNDLYSVFDATLPLYDVYKVETISDSYMIASGLPIRNGQQHSREIARLALQLMKESSHVKDKTEDGRLLLKIGIHTGPCVAGVTGQRMPRYCLFGDTINMASRMVSTSQALKIQLSTEAREHLMCYWSRFRFHSRGLIDIKGKGPRHCYWLIEESDHDHDHQLSEQLPGSMNGSQPEEATEATI